MNFRRYSLFVLKYRVIIFIAAVLLTLFSLYSIRSLNVKNDSDKFSVEKEDPVYLAQEFFNSLFGTNEYIYIVIEPDQNNQDVLSVLNSISTQIRKLDGVRSVFSLADAEEIEWIPYVNTLVPVSVPIFNNADAPDLEKFKRIFEKSDIYIKNLVDKNFSAFNIIINLDQSNKNIDLVISKIESILSSSGNNLKYYIAGTPLLYSELSSIVRQDLKVFVPLSILASILILIIAVREIFSIITIMLMSSLSLVWSLAPIGITGTSMSVGLSVIVPLILVINISYSLHCIYHYQHAIMAMKDKDAAHKKAMEEVLAPSLIAGIITAVGFFSLMTSDFRGIKEIGFFIGIGILSSMISANLVLPAMLTYRKRTVLREVFFSKTFVQHMYDFTINRYRLIIFSFIIISLAAVYGMLNLKTDTNLLHYIDENNQVRRGFNKMDSVFGGTIPLEIIVRSDYSSVEKDLSFIDSIGQRIKSDQKIGSILSVVDILKFIEASKPQDSRGYFIPFSYENRQFPKSLWKAISKSNVGRDFISIRDTDIYLRIACRVKSLGSEELELLLNRLELNGKKINNKIVIAGVVPLFVASNSYIINSQINSFITAFIPTLIFFLLLTGFKKVGLIALLPNLLPILFTFGLLGWINVPLDLSNIMIASIAIGIIVDDTIRFLYNYSKIKDLPAREKIKLVYDSISFPIVFTSVIVAAGFFILGFSSFVPTKWFGILSGILVLVAVLSDLILLPALLMLFEKQKVHK